MSTEQLYCTKCLTPLDNVKVGIIYLKVTKGGTAADNMPYCKHCARILKRRGATEVARAKGL